jgi:predicted  nucleic acid-binding Zn-ribbon protein
MQSRIDQLSAQITALDRRTREQAHALDAAQHDAQTARQSTQRLETEFETWRTELSLVRQAIQEQSTADLRALDELNSVLEQLVPEPTPPEPHPFFGDGSHMATDPQQGIRR